MSDDFITRLLEEMYKICGITPEELDAPPKTATGIQYYMSSRMKAPIMDKSPMCLYGYDDDNRKDPSVTKLPEGSAWKWDEEKGWIIVKVDKDFRCVDWMHSWKRYVGFREIYDYCEVCSVKRDLKE